MVIIYGTCWGRGESVGVRKILPLFLWGMKNVTSFLVGYEKIFEYFRWKNILLGYENIFDYFPWKIILWRICNLFLYIQKYIIFSPRFHPDFPFSWHHYPDYSNRQILKLSNQTPWNEFEMKRSEEISLKI